MRTCSQCQRTFSDDTDYCPRDGTPLVRVVTPTEAELAAGLARRYRIIRRLGGGGMGTVFLAEQIAVGNRPVALKVLLRKLLDDPEFLLRFHNEAASTGRIHHPNVVTIYESGQADDGTPYIAMEYLEGETLREALTQRGAMAPQETVEIIQQVARGLNAAHRLGIIHRDLKPDNLFLTPGEEVGEASGVPTSAATPPATVKIVDFGIAKLRESATHTIAGTVLGTPAYMSFEQAAGMRSDELDLRSDIYSLGVVVYEMLTGRVPFHADTPLGYVRKHLTEEPPPFRAVKPDLPALPQLERVVLKALRKARNQRCASALEFARELAEAAGGTQPTVPLPQTRVVPPEAPASEVPKVAAGPGRVETTIKTPPSSMDADRIEPLQKGARLVGPAPIPAAPALPRAVAPSPAKPAGVPPPQPRPTPARASRAKHVVFVFLVLAAAGTGTWYWWQSPLQPQVESKPPAESAAKTPAPPSVMIDIPGGTFMMGRDNVQDPEETPAHAVSVEPFSLDKTPVTNAQYAEFVKAAGHPVPPDWSAGDYPAGESEWPVTNVSWEDAQAYCKSKGNRLATEAEWEYAARGTDGRLYPWGNEFSIVLTSPGRTNDPWSVVEEREFPANSLESQLGRLETVGKRPKNASPFGVLDMSGNVWQWCQDDYKPYPGHQPTFEIPAGAKVIRGGSFKSDKDHVTTTTRNLELATSRSPTIGFRCAR
jgi:serine/threonine-protein kinase